MDLTKQEQTVVIGKLKNNILGVKLVKEHIDPQKLEKAVAMHNKMNDDMSPRECRE
ncbi:hypothetical protein CN501_08295 [Bacillus cereus]|uniref:hypothetical protein n=1 Tax=Bacillus cereus TaxID=1396 RepID=UPI000BF97300|nr:hypothetical protein [Bacillus cereus]PES17530.1 hypothetical protein CN501_08295 [Bacillus cereus]